ncbi:nucleotide-diphospho-sugar transferase [Favolaschia claudopus]|uniref:dolichyl-phosphate beta-D-mannosyltransferase n=1 Tax=Favolaschia claudopus TaxID=2862362 RepID=A0AAV9ZL94_9AGAR
MRRRVISDGGQESYAASVERKVKLLLGQLRMGSHSGRSHAPNFPPLAFTRRSSATPLHLLSSRKMIIGTLVMRYPARKSHHPHALLGLFLAVDLLEKLGGEVERLQTILRARLDKAVQLHSICNCAGIGGVEGTLEGLNEFGFPILVAGESGLDRGFGRSDGIGWEGVRVWWGGVLAGFDARGVAVSDDSVYAPSGVSSTAENHQPFPVRKSASGIFLMEKKNNMGSQISLQGKQFSSDSNNDSEIRNRFESAATLTTPNVRRFKTNASDLNLLESISPPPQSPDLVPTPTDNPPSTEKICNMIHDHTTRSSSSLSPLSSIRRSLPAWARDRRLPRPATSGPLPVFLTLLTLSSLITPSPSLYFLHDSSLYTPPRQPTTGPPITTSIIVPTFHERANIASLVETTYSALPPLLAKETEFVFVDDDSQDGTEEEVERLRGEGYPNLEILVRARGSGENGLSSAVIRGFERARGTRLVVMDADLQHPPSAIPHLLDTLEEYASPLALGTRYGKGVSMDRNWPLYRRVISWGARMLARPLTTASDPMTGFFALKKEAFEASAPLSPMGFKIALELLLSVPKASRPPEVPYAFGVRTQGASKLGAKVIVKYVLQLIHLYRRALGVFWHILVAGGTTGAVWAAKKVLVLRRRGLGGRLTGQRRGGGLLPLYRDEIKTR